MTVVLLGVEVIGSTDIEVMKGRFVERRCQFGLTIQAGFKDRLHTLIGTGIPVQSTLSRRFQTIGTICFSESQNAKTRAKALFCVRLGLKDTIDQLRGERADGSGP